MCRAYGSSGTFFDTHSLYARLGLAAFLCFIVEQNSLSNLKAIFLHFGEVKKDARTRARRIAKLPVCSPQQAKKKRGEEKPHLPLMLPAKDRRY